MSGNTTVSLDLANATPGGLHPWQLHRGQCGSDDGIVGSPAPIRSPRWAAMATPPRWPI